MPTVNIRKNGSLRLMKATVAVALVLSLLFTVPLCQGQKAASSNVNKESAASNVSDAPPAAAQSPLSEKERAELLKLIKELQDRVAKLEAAQPAVATPTQPVRVGTTSPTRTSAPDDPTTASADTSDNEPPDAVPADDKADDKRELGSYTPNLGFKIADTKYGDVNLSIYTYVRYLNQLGLDPTYVDAFGNEKTVQERQDVQLLKLQIKFLGWVLSPKLRYFLYAWSSNANQGQGAQVVLAGNLNYTFNRHITVGGGIRSLPGTRSVEGNFPFWSNVDSRHIADEFFRPSYTSGVWATGEITKRLKYQAMLGNNMSTLGVSAARLDNGFNTFSGALLWFPTGDFEKGFSGQGWGDFEHHEKFSTRFGLHYSRSDENRESQPNSDTFENTQLRLSDGSVIFTPELFGPGITVTDARWRMSSFDGAFKYRGFSVEGEYYLRWLDNFKGENTQNLSTIFDHGFQLQGTAMLRPESVQAYTGYSQIFGDYGDPWDFRAGINWFPYKNKVLRWNTEVLYLHKSPVGYTSVPFAVGARGWVFHSNVELAF